MTTSRFFRRKGFTLVELMVVIAMIGILGAIAMPTVGDALAKSMEGTTKANLGVIRSALSIYFGDTDGVYPTDGNALTYGNKYLQQIPIAYFPKNPNNTGHGSSHWMAVISAQSTGSGTQVTVQNGSTWSAGGGSNQFQTYDFLLESYGGGAWVYDGAGSNSTTFGTVEPMCIHKDISGQDWAIF